MSMIMKSRTGSAVGFVVLAIAMFTNGCLAEAQDQSDEPELGSQAQAVTGPWQRMLTDNFSNSGSLGAWQVTSRADYNSSICN